MKWAGYERCPHYLPLCEHSEDIKREWWGMCKYYYYPESYCSESDNCDGYGWRGLTHKRAIETKLQIAQEL